MSEPMVKTSPHREHLVRAMWTLFEPIHAVTYFAQQARDAFSAIGIPRYWDGYFAGRSAPLGSVAAAPVTAIFSGFAPFLVERALPAIWSTASPDDVLGARSAGAAATLRELFTDADAISLAADALSDVARRADTIGRPLSAANQALVEHPDPYHRLWQAAATLREHRGDGHVIALVTEGIAGLTTLILRAGVDLDATAIQRARGWTHEQWSAERDRLISRGLLADDGVITDIGAAAVNRAEDLTNQLAAGPWHDFSDSELIGLARLLSPIAHACSAVFPYPNPIGMPKPWDPTGDPDAARVPVGPVAGTAG